MQTVQQGEGNQKAETENWAKIEEKVEYSLSPYNTLSCNAGVDNMMNVLQMFMCNRCPDLLARKAPW